MQVYYCTQCDYKGDPASSGLCPVCSASMLSPRELAGREDGGLDEDDATGELGGAAKELDDDDDGTVSLDDLEEDDDEDDSFDDED